MGQPMQQTPPAVVDAIARETADARARNGDSLTDVAAAQWFAREIGREHTRRATESALFRTYDAATRRDLTLGELDDFLTWLHERHPTITVDIRGGYRDRRTTFEVWLTAPHLTHVLGDALEEYQRKADALALEMRCTDGDEVAA